MAIECMVWALEQDGLKTNEKFVLLGIANHSRPDGLNAYPSLDTISRYTALSRSTVQRAVASLVEKGFLTKDPGGGRKSNIYTLNMHRADVIQLEVIEGGQSDPPEDPEGGQSDPPAGSLVTTQQGQALTTQQGQALTKEPLYNRPVTALEPTRGKKRDTVWDAIMEACGVNTATINSNERGRYNKAVKLLRESGATAHDIHTRVQVYRRKFKGAAVTPVAVANHWSELDPATVKVEDVVAAPKGWSAIKQVREERDNKEDASPWE